jgi:hypothetical protein
MSGADGEAGRRLVAAVKDSARAGEVCLCLAAAEGGIMLRPVGTAPGAASADELRVLSEWRNRHVTAFLTEFEATPDRTAAWLESAVGPDPGRIIFTLREPDGAIFGHCGLAFADWTTGTFELDGVARGTPAVPGGMSAAVRTLLNWSIDTARPRRLRQPPCAHVLPSPRVRRDPPHPAAPRRGTRNGELGSRSLLRDGLPTGRPSV